MQKLDLVHMSLPAAMQLAEGLSGLSRDEICAAMGWSPSNGSRILNPCDAYWPTLPTLPKFCRVVKNTVLLDWAMAQIDPEQEHSTPLGAEEFVFALGGLFKEMGDVATVGNTCIQDGDLSAGDARKIRRELLDLMQKAQTMLSGLAAVETP
ncbi:hypothetical protein LWC08_03055 [Desulfobaculum bizertense]|uniref:hypothetical protein n=1 Tax=Desulfobaculum bizertense TaxID=376490 RepID=UPI001F41F5DC|nr:hypothetical protein [Desulfobaculum bizertense]UIJ38562.1 hypothetical protein LWC08_03055 [Desulfobaculum bizertense]